MKLNALLCSVVVLLPLSAAPAFAHHSFAMFDRSKTTTISGTVKELAIINPHGWLQMVVADGQGRMHEWSLETGPPGQLSRAGFQPTTLNAGDKVTAQIHPLRDGSNGGELVSVTLPSGKILSAGGPGGGNEQPRGGL